MPFHHTLRGPQIHWPTKRPDLMGKWLEKGISDEEWDKQNRSMEYFDKEGKAQKETPEQVTTRMNQYHKSSSGEHIKMQAHKEAVDQKARMAEFEAAQQGAPQSFGKHGKPFSASRYKDTSMLPARGSPKSDPARLQASPVGYDKDEWWRQNPYRSPVQENFSIFSMKPYSW